MKRLALALALVSCTYSELDPCPISVAWKMRGPDQCGYTTRTIPGREDCGARLSYGDNEGCAFSQTWRCANEAIVTQRVDPDGGFVYTRIVTADGCTAEFEGEITEWH